MEVIIDNKPAAIKSDSSFEYVLENRLFTDSDGYTLNITFPLKGCDENIEIFGMVFRNDVEPIGYVYDCEIRCPGFSKAGVIVITDINEAELKAQFLDGRSKQNYTSTFDKIYINELDLGEWPEDRASTRLKPIPYWRQCAASMGAVPLPWMREGEQVQENSYSNIDIYVSENDEPIAQDDYYEWAQNIQLSFMPYLITITKSMLDALGYTYNIKAWENSHSHKYLLLANVLPASMGKRGFADALPKWTVEQFFGELELLLCGDFEFDHKSKTVTFEFTEKRLAGVNAVVLDNPVAGYSEQIQVDDPRCEYIGAKNVSFKTDDSVFWKRNSCQWLLSTDIEILSYATMSELLSENRGLAEYTTSTGVNANKILYAKDVDGHFIVSEGVNVNGTYKSVRLLQINAFGPIQNAESGDDKGIELQMVPFSGIMKINEPTDEGSANEGNEPTKPLRYLAAGKPADRPQFFDRINIWYWDGTFDYVGPWPVPSATIAPIVIADDWSSYRKTGTNLRLNDASHPYAKARTKIDPRRKYTFSFLADSIPDVQAMFLIAGQRYLCAKLTATFDRQGMSKLIKGEFYAVVD